MSPLTFNHTLAAKFAVHVADHAWCMRSSRAESRNGSTEIHSFDCEIQERSSSPHMFSLLVNTKIFRRYTEVLNRLHYTHFLILLYFCCTSQCLSFLSLSVQCFQRATAAYRAMCLKMRTWETNYVFILEKIQKKNAEVTEPENL